MPALAEVYHSTPVEFSTPREIVGSKAFNLEYLKPVASDERLRADIVSYLGEYRYQVPKFQYDLFLVQNGQESYIADSQGSSMQEAAQRSLRERAMRGDPVHREINEQRGLENLKNKLQVAQAGDSLVWGSPPGPKDEGYGNYGFVYAGKVGEITTLTTKTGEKLSARPLRMNAIRVEEPTIEAYNKAFNRLTGKSVNFSHADEFLKSPEFGILANEGEIDAVLKEAFSFSPNEEEQERFEDAVKIMNPLINKLIFALKNDAPNSEKIKLFYALENYAIALKEGSVRIEPGLSYGLGQDVDTVVANFGRFKPPVATGSCGSTGSLISNQLFGSLSILGGIFDKSDEGFECPKCAYTTTSPVGDQCPSCKLTKEQFMEEGGIACD